MPAGLKEIKSVCAKKCSEDRAGLGITTEWDGITNDSKVAKKLLKGGLPTDPGICLNTKSLH